MSTPIWVSNTPIIVPSELVYNDANGYPVTSLYPLPYLILVGQDLNNLIESTDYTAAVVSGNTLQIAYLTNIVNSLPPTYHTPTLYTQCLTPSGSTILPIDQILNYMVTAWCGYISVTGSQSALAGVVAQQCPNLNTAPSFSAPGTSMSAITGWKNAPATLADSLNNLWLTECDSRAGVTNALAAITPTCAQVIINSQIVLNSQLTFAFYFDGYTFIPSGFTDNGSQIQITDTTGNIYLTSFNIVTQSTTQSPFIISASGSTLSPQSPSYTVRINSNVTNSTLGLTCVKSSTTVVNVIPLNGGTSPNCCPDIGNYTGSYVSGTTITFISSLSYTPRYVQIVPKNAYTASQLYSGGGSPWLVYTSTGAILDLLSPLGSPGTLNFDWISFR